MRLETALVGVCLLVGLSAEQGFAQQLEQSNEGYIEKVFMSRIGELPRMGWFAPLYGFLVPDDASEVFLYAPLGMPSTGRGRKLVTGSEVKEIRQLYNEACDIGEADHLTALDVGGDTEPARAFYTTRKLPGHTRAGLISISLDRSEMANVNRVLGWPIRGALRRDEAIGARSQSFYYSLHRLYRAKTGLLSEEAVVLHGKDGQILAHKLSRGLDSAPPCDGCGIPSYEYAGSGMYSPIHMFESSGFAYPLLLLDSSTVEGRALSLLTFTPDRKVTEFRIYEYVIGCR